MIIPKEMYYFKLNEGGRISGLLFEFRSNFIWNPLDTNEYGSDAVAERAFPRQEALVTLYVQIALRIPISWLLNG